MTLSFSPSLPSYKVLCNPDWPRTLYVVVKVTLNFWFSHFYFVNVGITGTYNPAVSVTKMLEPQYSCMIDRHVDNWAIPLIQLHISYDSPSGRLCVWKTPSLACVTSNSDSRTWKKQHEPIDSDHGAELRAECQHLNQHCGQQPGKPFSWGCTWTENKGRHPDSGYIHRWTQSLAGGEELKTWMRSRSIIRYCSAPGQVREG